MQNVGNPKARELNYLSPYDSKCYKTHHGKTTGILANFNQHAEKKSKEEGLQANVICLNEKMCGLRLQVRSIKHKAAAQNSRRSQKPTGILASWWSKTFPII